MRQVMNNLVMEHRFYTNAKSSVNQAVWNQVYDEIGSTRINLSVGILWIDFSGNALSVMIRRLIEYEIDI